MLKLPKHAPALALILCTATALSAQERRQGGPPPYDPAREVTITGVVKAMETIEVPDGTRAILVLTVNNENLGILMGPETWVKKQGMTFAPGASVQVVGIPGYKYNGGAAMTPRTVKLGTKVLKVRDESGKPLWDQ